MGILDIPLESMSVILTIVLLHFSYIFYKNSSVNLKSASVWFFASFISLFVASVFDLLDEFFSIGWIDVAGETLLVVTFILFIVALMKFRGEK